MCANTTDDSGACSTDGSRDPAGVYVMQFTYDGIPSPTTQNWRILLFGQPKYHHLVPPSGRYLTLRERGRVLGFDDDAVDAQARHLSVGIRQVALGNTICVDVDAAVLDTIVSKSATEYVWNTFSSSWMSFPATATVHTSDV